MSPQYPTTRFERAVDDAIARENARALTALKTEHLRGKTVTPHENVQVPEVTPVATQVDVSAPIPLKPPVGMKIYSSERLIYGPDRKLHFKKLNVMAVTGPEAAQMFRDIVTNAFVQYGPKIKRED